MRNILIVEPDPQIRRLLELWLAEAGHLVLHEPGDGPPTQQPDLVIADIGTATRNPEPQVEALREAHRAPLLLISGHFRRGLTASRDAARRFGVQAVLPTPFNQSELLAAVGIACAG